MSTSLHRRCAMEGNDVIVLQGQQSAGCSLASGRLHGCVGKLSHA